MKKSNQKFVITVLAMIMVIVYLFVMAPPPLEDKKTSGVQLPIEFVLRLANEENKVARRLYTEEIVQAGTKIGIKFSEEWQDQSIIAGMLPAQFLRETAMYLEKSPVRLGLYLGSDYPINKVNLIEGMQAKKFQELKTKNQDVFFNAQDEQSFIYMSPDVAAVKACVSCHNEHPQTPKTDWKLNEIMGATTWLYPERTISVAEALVLLRELRNGFGYAYELFLGEVKQMQKKYVVSNKWPKDGRYIPSKDVFMNALSKRASDSTLSTLLQQMDESK